MQIINDLLSTLNHEVPVERIVQGAFQTAVLTRHCGLASTPHDSSSHYDKSPVKEAGHLLKHDAAGLARKALSSSPNEASIGMAAINSMLDVDAQQYEELNAADLIARKGENKKVAIVGHFPFITRLRPIVKELWVIEKNPQEGDFSESSSENLIPQADVIGITGTALTNHTMESLLKLCSPGAYVVVLGGTAPLSPILFDYGINAVSGTLVTDSELVFCYVSQGATFRQIKGIRLLTMTREKD